MLEHKNVVRNTANPEPKKEWFTIQVRLRSSLGPSEESRQKSLPRFRSDLGSTAVNEQFDTRDETGVMPGLSTLVPVKLAPVAH